MTELSEITDPTAHFEAEDTSCKQFHTEASVLLGLVLTVPVDGFLDKHEEVLQMRELAAVRFKSLTEFLESSNATGEVEAGLELLVKRYGTYYAILDSLLTYIEMNSGDRLVTETLQLEDF